MEYQKEHGQTWKSTDRTRHRWQFLFSYGVDLYFATARREIRELRAVLWFIWISAKFLDDLNVSTPTGEGKKILHCPDDGIVFHHGVVVNLKFAKEHWDRGAE